MKKLYIIVVLALVAVLTLPLWGSCDLNAAGCRHWCSVRHYGSDLRIASCRVQCSTDRLQCLAGQGAREVERFIDRQER